MTITGSASVVIVPLAYKILEPLVKFVSASRY